MVDLCRNYDKLVTDCLCKPLQVATVFKEIPLPNIFFKALCVAAFGLWLVSVAQDVCIYGFQCADTHRIIGLLDVEAEKSFYTWFSVCVLFLAGFLAFRRADAIGQGGRHYWHWVFVSVIFVYLSCDEALTAHEKLAKLGAMIIKPEGFFRYDWVVPAMILVVVVIGSLIGMVRALPRREQFLTYVSAAFYVGGAAGMEMISGKISDIWGEHTVAYQAVNSLEEAMEVIGVFIFIHVLMSLERLGTRAGRERVPQAPMHSDHSGVDTGAVTNL